MRLDSLTALRFVAAVGVVLCHLRSYFPQSANSFLFYLQIGVDFFFVLSGFVLTWSWRPQRSRRRFYWLRFARVWPLHIATLIAWVAVTREATARQLALSIPLLQSWSPQQSIYWGLNGVSWTLSVEALFYALFPFLIRPLSGLAGRGLWIAFAACISLGVLIPVILNIGISDADLREWATYYLPATRVPQFVLGVVSARLAVCESRFPLHPLVPASVALAALAVAGFTHPPVWQVSAVVAPAAACLMIACARKESAHSWGIPRSLVLLGESSFALYLTHPLVLRGLHRLHLPGALMVVASLTVAIAVSIVAYKYFERPVERWLRGRWLEA